MRHFPIAPKLIAASSVGIVLSILRERESYGYAILQRVREVSGGALEWNEGMLYPVLHRLEKDGLIVARWDDEAGARRRKYYRISARGREALAREQREWESVDSTLRALWRPQHG